MSFPLFFQTEVFFPIFTYKTLALTESQQWSLTINPISWKSIAKTVAKNVFPCTNGYNTVADSRVFLLNWKSGDIKTPVSNFFLLLTSSPLKTFFLQSRVEGVQVLRQHGFDLFWPTHPPYQQMSAFPIPTLNMTRAFSHTHPPIYRFFPL